MKTYKNLIAIFVIITISIGFSACSDDGNFSDTDSNDTVSITDCNETGLTIPDDYTTMLSADTLVQDATNTVVTTYHNISGTKKVCIESGTAYIIR